MFSRETEAFDREMGVMLNSLQLQFCVCRLSWYGALPQQGLREAMEMAMKQHRLTQGMWI